MNLTEVIIIISLLILVYIINPFGIFNKSAGFWSDTTHSDRVLESYSSHPNFESFLPSNKIILKGHNSAYWDCYEMNKAMGAPSHEILSKCHKFV